MFFVVVIVHLFFSVIKKNVPRIIVWFIKSTNHTDSTCGYIMKWSYMNGLGMRLGY